MFRYPFSTMEWGNAQESLKPGESRGAFRCPGHPPSAARDPIGPRPLRLPIPKRATGANAAHSAECSRRPPAFTDTLKNRGGQLKRRTPHGRLLPPTTDSTWAGTLPASSWHADCRGGTAAPAAAPPREPGGDIFHCGARALCQQPYCQQPSPLRGGHTALSGTPAGSVDRPQCGRPAEQPPTPSLHSPRADRWRRPTRCPRAAGCGASLSVASLSPQAHHSARGTPNRDAPAAQKAAHLTAARLGSDFHRDAPAYRGRSTAVGGRPALLGETVSANLRVAHPIPAATRTESAARFPVALPPAAVTLPPAGRPLGRRASAM